jgi:hypothetical protein
LVRKSGLFSVVDINEAVPSDVRPCSILAGIGRTVTATRTSVTRCAYPASVNSRVMALVALRSAWTDSFHVESSRSWRAGTEEPSRDRRREAATPPVVIVPCPVAPVDTVCLEALLVDRSEEVAACAPQPVREGMD